MIHTGLPLPVLLCHGTQDDEIPESYGVDAFWFMQHGLRIPEQCLTYRRYQGLGHTITDAELDDTVSWLKHTLA